MRRLLTVALLACISTGSTFVTGVNDANAVATVTAYLYHPTGNPSNPPPNQAYMTCGWHTNCDPKNPDYTPKGLDWISDNGGDFNVYARLLMYSSGGQTQRVALAQFRTRYVGFCPQSVVYLKRYSDSVTIGTIVNQHSTYPSAADVPFYSSVAGYRNDYWAGTMVNNPPDSCSTGAHTMQWWENGITSATRNTAIPVGPQVINPNPIPSWSSPWEYSFYYTTQIWQDWQDWGPVWGQPQVTEVSSAAAHENPYVQTAHTVAARINRYGEGAGYNYEIREYTGTWGAWQDKNVWPTDPLFDGKIGISNHENEVHIVGVAQYNLWHGRRYLGSWNNWTNLGRPSVSPGVYVNIDGPVAVSNSSGRIVIIAIAGSNAYVIRWTGAVWTAWTPIGGGSSLGNAVAISTRPNGIRRRRIPAG